MSRKTFIESQGAACKNWNWSWSFINNAQRFVIFGAWDRDTKGGTARIFSEDWRVNAKGQKSKGYDQSREHIRLIEEEGFRLMTFPMHASEGSWEDGQIPSIKSFTPKLVEKTLARVGAEWFGQVAWAAKWLEVVKGRHASHAGTCQGVSWSHFGLRNLEGSTYLWRKTPPASSCKPRTKTLESRTSAQSGAYFNRQRVVRGR